MSTSAYSSAATQRNGRATERVLDLLPVHVRARDEQTGGLLRALVEAVAVELDVLEGDIDELYASWFVETCPEWVVPYLADLLGVLDLPPDVAAQAGVSRRAFVANTVDYRRRKGTAAVVEHVARDASGWPARAVEYFRLLATTTHTRHVRLDRPATALLRTPAGLGGPLELAGRAAAQGGLDHVAHTVDVRRIATGRGRYGIGNLGVFLFPDQVFSTGWAPARPPGGSETGWSVHPLGHRTPLYTPPATEAAIEHLATEADLPLPLRPRRLLALLTAARQAAAGGELAGPAALAAAIRDALPIGVRVSGEDLDPHRLRVCGLEDLARAVDEDPESDPEAPLPGWQVMIDAVRGRLHTYFGGVATDPVGSAQAPALAVRHSYGAAAEVGAGTHDRTGVHEDALATDPYRGDPARGGPGVTGQRAVLARDPDGLAAPTIAQALQEAEDAWAAGDLTGEGPAGGTHVIAIGDDETYPGDLTVHVPAATRLVLVAATWAERVLAGGEVLPPPLGSYDPQGLRPHLAGTLTITGDGGSSVVLDGLVVTGDVVVGESRLGSLAVSQCTIAGALRVGLGAPSNLGLEARLVRSVCGPVRFGPAAASLRVCDSVVDPRAFGEPGEQVAVAGAGLVLDVQASTVRGRVAVRTLEASSAVLDGHVEVEHRQTGCVRYSYIEPGSRVPQRFRCVPDPAARRVEARQLRPTYAATDAGSPQYLALSLTCPPEIATGGECGSEMGVHHQLARPLRLAATGRLLAPYAPAGLEIGVFAPVATAISGAGGTSSTSNPRST